ncbi:AAA family ATPase [Gordonia sp. FQ]|uniref:AAA family ATPase n=1 Tax=Gordonia sp. FQ TaxID=3446634 RepID=UPI003F830A83
MRLHRLRLRDYRGIAEREIDFADSGITVVEGANEAGKSSMIEALDLLLQYPSSSKSTAVRAVQPAGRDVGSEVFAEISCGHWRFEYFKRFNKKAEAALTIIEPRREQLTGRAAHERVEQILAESLDSPLYRALRLQQSGAPELGRLSDSSALARALDRATTPVDAHADDGDGDADAQALIAAAEAEYQRYYTLKAGRPAGELAAAMAAARMARAELDERHRGLDAAERAAAELPDVEQAYREATAAEVHALEELADASRRVADAEKVAAALDQAAERAQRREIAVRLAERDLADRQDAQRRVAVLADQVDAARESAAELAGTAERADAEVADLDGAVTAARARHEALSAELTAAVEAERVRADRARIAEIEAVLNELSELAASRAGIVAGLESNPVGAEQAEQAVRLDRALAVAQARVEAAAARVEVTPLGGEEVLVDGAAIGDAVALSAVGDTVIETTGVRVRVIGAAGTRALSDDLDALRRSERELLTACRVESLAEVAMRAAERGAAGRALADVEAAGRRLLGGSTEQALSGERDRLLAASPGEAPAAGDRPVDQLRVAEREQQGLVARGERAASARRAEAAAARVRAQAQAETAERAASDLAVARAELLEQRARISDEALSGVADTARAEHAEACAVVDEQRARAQRLDLPGLRAACAEAEQRLDRLRGRIGSLRDQRTQLRTLIEQCRTENRLDDLTRAQTADRAAAAELERVTRRAEGARLLYRTLTRTRAESRARYVAPFTERLETLAKPVFGESVRFEVDDDFTIASRTLDGVTVDASALSGGAREQLGLIARLACAMIVDPGDGVPVILDDALGYSDPARLASMAGVLGDAAGGAQIIVLTCTPDRYAAVPDARVVAV